jgi:hypothetical protein
MDTSEIPRRPSWIRRNWKWVAAVWLGLGISGSGVAFFAMANSDARQLAIAGAQSNPAVEERLGHPIQAGWFTSGEIEVNEAGGHAELAIPISGPKGKGTIYVEAHKRAGIWKLDLLQFGDGGADRLDLLPGTQEAPAAACQQPASKPQARSGASRPAH